MVVSTLEYPGSYEQDAVIQSIITVIIKCIIIFHNDNLRL